MEDSAHSAAPVSRRMPDDVEVYDFRRSATLSRENARALEISFETFARQWSAQLSAKTRVRVTVSVETVMMQPYGEYAHSLPATTTLVVCALPDSAERLILQLPSSAAVAWIVQLVGGRASETMPERAFTPIEAALLTSLMADAIDLLTGALEGRLPSGVSVAGLQYNPQFAQVAAAGEPVIVARLPMQLGGRTELATVMLPASVLVTSSEPDPVNQRDRVPELVRRHVEASPVEVSLRLASRGVRPREILELTVGDVVALPHAADRPLSLFVDDQPVAAAAVGSSGARLACVVTAITPDPAEEPA